MLLNGFRNAKFLTIESPSCLRNNLVDISMEQLKWYHVILKNNISSRHQSKYSYDSIISTYK